MPTDDSGRLQFSGGSLSHSTPPPHWIVGLSAVLWALGTISQAQTQAACTFTFFPTIHSSPNAQLFPFGINDFGTVVGGAFTTSNTGFIRYASGGLTFPNATSSLVDRNDSGASIGYTGYLNAMILRGMTATPIVLTIGSKIYKFLDVEGINNWGTIVGWYTDSTGVSHGFKRWSNGGGISLNYPAPFSGLNSGTLPMAINDSGTIVGFTQLPFHGFMYHQGEWATLEYPNANSTLPIGISNAGVVIGNSSSADGTSRAFLYNKGVFKVISPPNATGSYVTGMSLKSGLILGVAYSNVAFGGQQGFVAKCN